MHRYKVTCLNCKKSDNVVIDENGHRIMDFEGKMLTNLTAGRWRPDLSWGWECVCGNYDLLAKEEVGDMNKLVSGSPMRIMEIVKMLKQKPQRRFAMENA